MLNFKLGGTKKEQCYNWNYIYNITTPQNHRMLLLRDLLYECNDYEAADLTTHCRPMKPDYILPNTIKKYRAFISFHWSSRLVRTSLQIVSWVKSKIIPQHSQTNLAYPYAPCVLSSLDTVIVQVVIASPHLWHRSVQCNAYFQHSMSCGNIVCLPPGWSAHRRVATKSGHSFLLIIDFCDMFVLFLFYFFKCKNNFFSCKFKVTFICILFFSFSVLFSFFFSWSVIFFFRYHLDSLFSF